MPRAFPGIPVCPSTSWPDTTRSTAWCVRLHLLSLFQALARLTKSKQKKIRRWIVATERNSTRIDNWHHILHCLDTLRQNILCEADDTPLYNTQMEGKQAGPDEVRHCRSWDEMEAWAVRHSGCFGYVNETADESGGLDYYKYCPEGSRFLPAVREYFGLPDDWFEVPVEQVPPY